jgi:cell division protein FtsL
MVTTEFYTVKRIDNSRLKRPAAPNRWREYARLVTLVSVLGAGGLLYVWQHFQCVQLRYQVEELKAERSQAAELNSQLKLETAALKSPLRIDAIARHQLGLSAPVPGQVTPVFVPAGAVLAEARATPAGATR